MIYHAYKTETVLESNHLTSVGHEDLQAGVLEKITSGEDSPNLTEHPFSMQTLRVGQDLTNTTEVSPLNIRLRNTSKNEYITYSISIYTAVMLHNLKYN